MTVAVERHFRVDYTTSLGHELQRSEGGLKKGANRYHPLDATSFYNSFMTHRVFMAARSALEL
jgi:hypothetical protein